VGKMNLFALAEQLSRTVAELEQSMDAYEFAEWCAYYAIKNEE